jgi:hypothetical protein
MTLKRILHALTGVILMLIFSCSSPEALPPEELEQWARNPKNGLTKVKEVNGFTLSARLIPASLLAYRDFTSQDSVSMDSLVCLYQGGTNFIVTLEAEKNQDMMRYNIRSANELTGRIQYLNFQIPEFIELQMGDTILPPVVYNFEGFNQLNQRVTFNVAFATNLIQLDKRCNRQNKQKSSQATLLFLDPAWDTGTSKFTFDSASLAKVPKIR